MKRHIYIFVLVGAVAIGLAGLDRVSEADRIRDEKEQAEHAQLITAYYTIILTNTHFNTNTGKYDLNATNVFRQLMELRK